MRKLTWNCKVIDDLSAREMHEILQLRELVFIIEQNCIYQDVDHKDEMAYHLQGRNGEGKLVAYARLIPAGISYDEVSIGRVVSHPDFRGTGAGRELVAECLEQMELLFSKQSIRISAQLYLLNFYQSFGFKELGEVYDEDGLPHIEMLLEK